MTEIVEEMLFRTKYGDELVAIVQVERLQQINCKNMYNQNLLYVIFILLHLTCHS